MITRSHFDNLNKFEKFYDTLVKLNLMRPRLVQLNVEVPNSPGDWQRDLLFMGARLPLPIRKI